jgi:hypothetical protein
MKRNEWSKRINEMQRVRMKIKRRSKSSKEFEMSLKGALSGDDPLTHDSFPHKHDSRAIRLSHS